MAYSGEHITLLLGVFAGNADPEHQFLRVQLESFNSQDHRSWSLMVSDDSPKAELRGVIDRFASRTSQSVSYTCGPGAGFSANYMALLRAAPDGMIAFSDQDDLWYPDKLARAAAALKEIDGPALYCGRVTYWRDDYRRLERPATRPAAFQNALIENIARGNTIVLNAEGAGLMRTVARRVGPVFAHDWLCYLVVSGAGGRIIYDMGPPLLDYRQHGRNEIGAGTGLAAQANRKLAVLRGAFSARLDSNIAALEVCSDLLNSENRRILADFASARGDGPVGFQRLVRLGLYRQSRLGTLGFWGASAIGRA